MSSVPLVECLPWNPAVHRRVLVADSLQTDGRFLSHTLASQVLGASSSSSSSSIAASSSSGQIFWISGAPLTSTQIATALKKIGCEAGTSYLRNNDKPTKSSLTIRPLAVEIAAELLNDPSTALSQSSMILRQVYQDLKRWLTQFESEEEGHQGPRWVILDDMSSLASVAEEKTVYSFINSIVALSTRNNNQFGVLIRASFDHDQKLIQKAAEANNNLAVGWLGAGGRHREADEWIPWERSLVELADGIVDVVPLSSGYSREAHGRLTFSERAGGFGWGADRASQKVSHHWNQVVVNYCLTDGGVRAIRLRGSLK